jgi:hypothetical protein
MNLLPKNRNKRNQLFLTIAVVLIAMGGVGYGLIRPQYVKVKNIKKQTADTQAKYKTYQTMIQQSDATASELTDVSSELASNEQGMATGDIYAWTLETIHHFKTNYKVEVPEIGQPSISDEDLFPHFPYKQLKFSLRGTGYYHDIGKFIADFENKYPHMRVVNLDIEPTGTDGEKLSFRVEIVALVKSAS